MGALAERRKGGLSEQQLLFITSNRIGDAVLSSGILAQMLDAHPGADVTIACGTLPAPLFADVPGLRRLHPIVRRGRIGHWWDLWRSVAGQRWTVAADIRSPLFVWTVRAGRRLAFQAEKRREHRVEELARQLSLSALPTPRIYVSDARQARIDLLWEAGPPILAVGPTANWGAKQWPADRFAELSRRLTAPDGLLAGARVAVFGAAHERAAAQPVLDAVPAERRLDWVGAPDLLDVFALLRRCAFYVGNDSGLMHMAAAAGIPTLGLFGPSAEWRYGPWGPRCAAIRTRESFEELVGAPDFHHLNQASLMGSLTVETVLEAARALISRTG